MRQSRVLTKLRAGKPVTCTKVNIPDPAVVDLIGLAGFDTIWLCMEHGAIDWNVLGHMIRAAAAYDVDVLVRVPKGSYSDWIRPLELGASGLMIPHCQNAEEAQHIARMTRFHPVGRRPLDGGNRDGAYTALPLSEYMTGANENTFILVQIEDPEAIDQIDAIAAVEGIDGLFAGPGDLAQGLGMPGVYNHPLLTGAISRVADACKQHRKIWGIPSDLESLPHYLAMGARFLSCGADVVGLWDYYRGLRVGLEEAGMEFPADRRRSPEIQKLVRSS